MTSAAQQAQTGWSSATPDSDLVVGLLQAGRKQLQEPTVRAASGGSLSPLGWACMDAGRWDDALEAAAEVDDFSTGYQMDIVGSSPRGALVRRTAGSSDTPDSSQNTMAA
jgi:hypothetical protein